MAERMMRKDKKKRVLFFDDEPFISKALANSLTLFEWDVTFVDNINDLFKELKNNSFDILLLDIMAPIPEMENSNVSFSEKEINEMDNGMNTGIVLARKIWEFNNNIPILFLTAIAVEHQQESINHFTDEGKTCYCLRKPEPAIKVQDTLNQLLNLKNKKKYNAE